VSRGEGVVSFSTYRIEEGLKRGEKRLEEDRGGGIQLG
jgi:hypothetical protein